MPFFLNREIQAPGAAAAGNESLSHLQSCTLRSLMGILRPTVTRTSLPTVRLQTLCHTTTTTVILKAGGNLPGSISPKAYNRPRGRIPSCGNGSLL
jgi:hypothetical protein